MSGLGGGFEKLVGYVAQLAPGDLAVQRLEDVTLCAAWYDSYRDSSDIQSEYESLRQQLDLWVHSASPNTLETEGHRQQPLLRSLIREAVQGRVGEMHRDEVDFLYFAYGLAQRTGREEIFERPMSCLKPFLHELERRRDAVELEPGLPHLAERIHVYVTEDLQRAESRDVKVFAGISLAVRGPVLTHKGDVKLIGSVPAECALVVEGGSCYISGMVQGKVAVTNSCEVFDNVSGVVVARRGNVAARILLSPAIVISKEGSVACTGAENPKLVFACHEIKVSSSITGGTFLGRKVTVADEVAGGVIQATEKVEAVQFRHSQERPLFLVLRRGLTCQDYGEVLTIEAAKMLSNALKLRQRITNLDDLLQITEREADQYAGNILIYLLGEERDLSERLQKVQAMRRRLSFYERLQAGVRAITAAVDERLNSLDEPMVAEEEDFDLALNAATDSSPTDQLRRELMLLAAEGAVDRDLHELREDVLTLGRRLQRKSMDREGILQVLGRLLQRGENINDLAGTLRAQVDALEEALEHSIERAAIIDRAKAECARVEVLDQLLSSARKRRGNEVLLRKSGERSVKVLRRNIENRQGRIGEYRKSINDLDGRIRKIKERLWDVHQVSLPDNVLEGWFSGGACAIGRFEAGVCVCAWQHLIGYGRSTDKSLVFTPDTADDVITYCRTEHGTIEQQHEALVASYA